MYLNPVRVFLLGLALLAAACQPEPRSAEPAIGALSDDEKAVYAFGAAIGQQLAGQVDQLDLSEAELAAFQRGFADTLAGREPAVDQDRYGAHFQTLVEARLAASSARTRSASADFLAAEAAVPGAVRTDSGLVIRTLTPGTGARPAASDTVRVHYEGTLTSGQIFDSSIQRGQPTEFPLNQVIPCWTEGVQRMQVGEKARLVCPAEIAYGDRGAGPIPPGATLIFEVELLAIEGR